MVKPVPHGAPLPLSPTQVTPFHSSKPPTISVKSYLEDRCGAPEAPAPAPPGACPSLAVPPCARRSACAPA